MKCRGTKLMLSANDSAPHFCDSARHILSYTNTAFPERKTAFRRIPLSRVPFRASLALLMSPRLYQLNSIIYGYPAFVKAFSKIIDKRFCDAYCFFICRKNRRTAPMDITAA